MMFQLKFQLSVKFWYDKFYVWIASSFLQVIKELRNFLSKANLLSGEVLSKKVMYCGTDIFFL